LRYVCSGSVDWRAISVDRALRESHSLLGGRCANPASMQIGLTYWSSLRRNGADGRAGLAIVCVKRAGGGEARMELTRKLHGLLMLAASTALWLPAPAAAATPRCAAGAGGKSDIALDATRPLKARVGPPSEHVLATYRGAGAIDVAPHTLTDGERADVEAALERLPALHRRSLEAHLRRLSFVETDAGLGSALTSLVETCDGSIQFDITLRSSLLHDGLSAFLTRKEQGLFVPDQSGYSVHLDAGDAPALLYILLHEATHVVDRSGAIALDTADLRKYVWSEDGRALAPPIDESIVSRIRWRGAPPMAIGETPRLYEELTASPFVSLYGATAASEDIAELFAWQYMAAHEHVELKIEVRDQAGALISSFRPLETAAVRQRLTRVAQILARD